MSNLYKGKELEVEIMNELGLDRRNGNSDVRISESDRVSGIGYIYVLESDSTEKVYIGGQLGSILEVMMRLMKSADYYNISGYGYSSANELLKYEDCRLRVVYKGIFETKEEMNMIMNNTLKDNMLNCVNQKYVGGGKIRVYDKLKEVLNTKVRKSERVEKHYNMLLELKEYKMGINNGFTLEDIMMLKIKVKEYIDDLVEEQNKVRKKAVVSKYDKVECEVGDILLVHEN